jgi:hypothetical protein
MCQRERAIWFWMRKTKSMLPSHAQKALQSECQSTPVYALSCFSCLLMKPDRCTTKRAKQSLIATTLIPIERQQMQRICSPRRFVQSVHDAKLPSSTFIAISLHFRLYPCNRYFSSSPRPLLLLRSTERRSDKCRRTTKLDPDNTFDLAQQLLVRHRSARFEVSNLKSACDR